MRQSLILSILLLLLTASGVTQRTDARSWAGFSAPLLRGGSFAITGHENQLTLLVFLALADGSNQSPSHAATVVLSSLDHQYSSRGLRVMVVDDPSIGSHREFHRSDTINQAADWNLTVPILEDVDGRRANKYLVRAVPTTILIAANGKEIDRWVGYTRTAVIARAIESVLGGPLQSISEPAPAANYRHAPDRTGAINFFSPGSIWPDTDGVPINAHGAGFLYQAGTYYWYGEFKTSGLPGNLAQVGISCYSSHDLYNWKNEGIVLHVSNDPAGDIAKGSIIERPKVLYNARTHRYVMWFHLELKGQGYRAARVGIAVSSSPVGPFKYLRSFRPDGEMSRDMTLFEDTDGRAYLLASSEENWTIHLSELSRDYLSTDGHWKRIFIGQHLEAPTLLHYKGRYYFIASHCTGWAPNQAFAAMAKSIWGPWKLLGNPCIGPNADKTFLSQGTYLIQVHGKAGAFIFAADRWNPENAIDGRYVWLPVIFIRDGLQIPWHDHWQLTAFDSPTKQNSASDARNVQ
jgi:hypothetical protein